MLECCWKVHAGGSAHAARCWLQDIRISGFVLSVICCAALVVSAIVCSAYLVAFIRALLLYKPAVAEQHIAQGPPALLRGLVAIMLTAR